MLILGIDPGFALTGWGVIEWRKTTRKPALVEYGTITTKAGERYLSRLRYNYDEITKVLKRFKPDAVSIERLFFSRNRATALNVSQSRGVLLLAAEEAGVPVYEYHPNQIKKAVTNFKGAAKLQVGDAVKALLGLKEIPKPDDAADALAIAITHCFSYNVKMKLDGGQERL